MRVPDDPYPEILSRVVSALLSGDHDEAQELLRGIRFRAKPKATEKWPSRSVIAEIFTRDRYQCRYCGAKVILTPVLRLIARLYPESFPYHPNWKADSTHPAFAARAATLDHVDPIADGGDPVARENLVTACWGCNRRKGDLRLEEIGWSLSDPQDKDWMGLAERFNPLWERMGRPQLSEDERWWLRSTRELTSRAAAPSQPSDGEASSPAEADDERLLVALRTASPPDRARLQAALQAVQAAPRPLVDWHGGQPDADGVIQMPFPTDHPAVDELIEALGQANAIAVFDWMDWDGAHRYQRASDVLRAPVADAVRLITTFVRSEKFADGTIASAVEDGRLLAAAQRVLDEL